MTAMAIASVSDGGRTLRRVAAEIVLPVDGEAAVFLLPTALQARVLGLQRALPHKVGLSTTEAFLAAVTRLLQEEPR